MSGEPRRIIPRRAFQVTVEGLKRIVLGDGGQGGAIHLATHRDAAVKPLRMGGEPRGYLLVIAHSDRGALDAHTHQAIAAAALLADAATGVAVLVLGELTEDLATVGADRVFVATACDKLVFDPARDLAVASDLIARLNPHHILLADNATGDGDLGRRLAARLELSVAGHLAELKPDGVAAYWQGGAQMARRDLPRILLLDTETTDTALPFRGAGEMALIETPVVADSPYIDLGTPPVDATQLGLEEADFIVAAGNGVADVPTLLALAKTFDAAVGASRVAVDDGRFTRDKQVGATGKTVSANVYLAIGISGAVQHLQGIKAVRHVIAINMDASAPISGRADLTVVDDAQAVMEQLLEATRGRNFADHLSPEGRGLRAAADEGFSAVAPAESLTPSPQSSPLRGEGADRVSNPLRVLVLSALGRNSVSGAARPNRDDLLALELGRGLGDVELLHAGNPDQAALGEYLAFGAEKIQVVPTAEGQDIASALAERAGGYDLILTGTRAEGGEGSGLVPYLVAERLGWPIVAQALDIRIVDCHAEVTQALPRGQRRQVRVRLPAVIAVDRRAPVVPRYAHARRMAGKVVPQAPTEPPTFDTSWRVEPAAKRPVKLKAKEQKAGHARMLSAIVTEARGGAVISTGTPADKAQAILAYLRTHKLIDW